MPWGKKLARPLMLKDGTVIRTLSDARAIILERFATVTHSEPLAYAGELLLDAAASGDRDDIAAATDQLELVLRARRLL